MNSVSLKLNKKCVDLRRTEINKAQKKNMILALFALQYHSFNLFFSFSKILGCSYIQTVLYCRDGCVLSGVLTHGLEEKEDMA